jgi:hypothetical protein
MFKTGVNLRWEESSESQIRYIEGNGEGEVE